MLTDKQIAALHAMASAWSDLEYVVIGATALDLFGLFAWRQTDDLWMSRSQYLSRTSRVRLSGYLVGRARVPIAGARRMGCVWTSCRSAKPPEPSTTFIGSTGETMRVQGFQHVFARRDDVSVDGVIVPVAPPAVVFLLKVYALLDNVDRVEKDLADVAHLLEAYVGDDDSRRFEDNVLAAGLPFEVVPTCSGRTSQRSRRMKTASQSAISSLVPETWGTSSQEPSSASHHLGGNKPRTRWSRCWMLLSAVLVSARACG